MSGPDARATTPQFQPLLEVRLAIVMYGGSSLAVYINGVAQELLHLVRATAPRVRYGTGSDDLLVAESDLEQTEHVYRKLGRLIKGGHSRAKDVDETDPVRTRFVVDIISGSSAGGINGVFLAKALATQVDMDAVRQLWVDEGDIGVLINDRESARGLPGVQAKNPPRSLLNGGRMYSKLLYAFDAMDWPPGAPATAGALGQPHSPLVDQLDLYVTTTDLGGLVLPIRLADMVIGEPRHRNVFHFVYGTTEASGGDRNDFTPAFNPFLAFATRCTASLPFVFEPMRLLDIDPVVRTFDHYAGEGTSAARRWRSFYQDYLAAPGTAPQPQDEIGPSTNYFATRGFGDGGALDNKPFSYATNALLRRRADVPVDRKLLYVEPDPATETFGERPPEPPDALLNLLQQVHSLPRLETIRDDITRILDRNRQLERIGRVLESLPRDMEAANSGRRPGWVDDRDLQDRFLDELVDVYGLSFGSYQRLRVADVTDDFARLLTVLAGLSEDSDEFLAVRHLVRAWRDRRYAHYRAEAVRADGTEKLPFSSFLARIDLTFSLRRLTYLIERTNELFDEGRARKLLAGHGLATQARWTDVQRQLSAARQTLSEAFVRIRAAGRSVRTPAARNPIWLLLHGPDAAGTVRSQGLVESLRALLEARLRGELTERNRQVPEELTLTEADIERRASVEAGTLRAALAHVLLQQPDEAARAEIARDVTEPLDDEFDAIAAQIEQTVRSAVDDADRMLGAWLPGDGDGSGPSSDPAAAIRGYIGTHLGRFLEYDMVTYPMRFGTDLGEADEVEIFRISPRDATRLIDVSPVDPKRKKVAGAQYGHFGAFFDRLWRENDILWGRLDAAERLIETLVPAGPDHEENVRTLCDEAFKSILWAELSEPDRLELIGLTAEALRRLRPEDRNEAALLAFVQSQVGFELREPFRNLLLTLLTEEQVLQYYRMDYTLDEHLATGPALRNLARATHVVGQVMKGISTERQVKFLAGPMAWVARIGQLLSGVVEAATPQRMTHLLVRHWLVLLYVLEGILIAAGILIGLPHAQQWGWTLLGITAVVNVVILIFQDLIRGGRLAASAFKVVAALVLLAAIAMIALEATHLGRDLHLQGAALKQPPSLPVQMAIEDNQWLAWMAAGVLAAASLLMSLPFWNLETRLVPAGIVSFELAGTAIRTQEILKAWGPDGRTRARWNLVADFLFIVLYASSLYVLVTWATIQWDMKWSPIVWTGYVLAWAQIAAGALDVAENVCLLLILRARWKPGHRLPSLARTFAWWKFLFIAMGLAYIVGGVCRRMFTWPGAQKLWLIVPLALVVVAGVAGWARASRGRATR